MSEGLNKKISAVFVIIELFCYFQIEIKSIKWTQNIKMRICGKRRIKFKRISEKLSKKKIAAVYIDESFLLILFGCWEQKKSTNK